MRKQGKVWGYTSPLFKKNNVEIHRIFGKKDGYCSKHCHCHKYNMFFVESGSLSVNVWKDYGLVDESVLVAGESLVVSPGEYHQFKILDDETVVYEIYWTEIDDSDIQRESQGGIENVEGTS